MPFRGGDGGVPLQEHDTQSVTGPLIDQTLRTY